MSVENRTTTRDGIQIQAYELQRISLRQGDPSRLFRALHDDDQAMFRDYGTLKHTTLAAQCAVCHRLHNVSDANLEDSSPLILRQNRDRQLPARKTASGRA